MSKRRKAYGIAGILAVLATCVPLAMQVDRYILERRQLAAQATYRQQVERCETGGGKWARGDCVTQD